MERGIRRLQGVTTQQRTEMDQVLDDLWVYYRQLKDYQQQPTPEKMAPLQQRFDEIFERHYPHHYALNLAMKQFCLHKTELLRVLDPTFRTLNWHIHSWGANGESLGRDNSQKYPLLKGSQSHRPVGAC